MIDSYVQIWVEERRNAHTKNGKEWALNIRISDHNKWTMKSWDSKPREEEVQGCKDLIMRSFEVYHRHLKIPQFNMHLE